MAIDRVDVAKGGGDWDNPLLLNYALAMEALDDLKITDQRSWKCLGAMHGFDRDYWISVGVITNDTTLPPSLTDGTFGDQCQHGTWYFLPWHRGYLFAFEAIVAAKVKELTGDDWALPYWNYLDPGNPAARRIPAAFEAAKMPNGRDNPLLRYPRQARGALPTVPPQRDINLGAMDEDNFVVGREGRIGYGGGRTGFIHFGGKSGQLEINPHNAVHGMIGGFMGDPYLAGLDPLFWLHHCNIDRLWEAWMATSGKTVPDDQDWRDRPTTNGGRTFMMPGPKAGDPPIAYTARATLEGGALHRSYDDLQAGTGVVPGEIMVGRVNMGAPEDQQVEQLGSNEDVIALGSSPVQTEISVDVAVDGTTIAQMGATEPGETVSRLYLDLESIRGAAPSATVDVYLNLPADAVPEEHPDYVAGSLHLFGLNRASNPNGGHAGNGLGQALDITDLAARLSAHDDFDPAHLRVTLVPVDGSSDETPITVDKVSVLKRTGVVTEK